MCFVFYGILRRKSRLRMTISRKNNGDEFLLSQE